MEGTEVPLQVLADLWRVRWGHEKVPARVLSDTDVTEEFNWHRIAQRLKIEGIVDRIPVHFTAGSAVYQLKEKADGPTSCT